MVEYKNYEVSFCDDCGENEGGIYCEVYIKGCDESIDHFAIPYYIKENEREQYAIEWLKANYFVQTKKVWRMNGNSIIRCGVAFWAVILVVSTFFIKNDYITAFMFFFGAMAVVSIFAIGCDKLEKNKEKLKVPEWLEGLF